MEPSTPTKTNIWNLLNDITSKDNWYSKVFNPKILQKWRDEIKAEYKDNHYHGSIDDMISQVIQILQTSAQGTNINHDTCTWEDTYPPICNACLDRMKQKVLANPKEYEYDGNEDLDAFLEDWDTWDDYLGEDWFIHSLCKCKGPDSTLNDYVVYSSQGLLLDVQRTNLKKVIAEMMKKLPIDWHPGSNQQVRDLIHPSICPYVKGISALANGKVGAKVIEKFRYQWLPSDFCCNNQGRVRLISYINNLPSQSDGVIHKSEGFMTLPSRETNLSTLIINTLERLIPSFEKVIHQKLKGRNFQAVVKVASTHLDLTKPKFPGGSWHIEGTQQEHIIATGLHYLTVEGITNSFLEFRKPVIINEEDLEYPQSDTKFTTHHYGITPGSHHNGEMNRYLGLIKCQEGASVVFPNTLQHHVKEFSLKNNSEKGTRIILAFFLIDPNHRIISTKDILPQQEDYLGKKSKVTFSKNVANFHRERLMFHRKFVVDEMNQVFERPFSLCEH